MGKNSVTLRKNILNLHSLAIETSKSPIHALHAIEHLYSLTHIQLHVKARTQKAGSIIMQVLRFISKTIYPISFNLNYENRMLIQTFQTDFEKNNSNNILCSIYLNIINSMSNYLIQYGNKLAHHHRPIKEFEKQYFFFLIIDKNNSLILTPEKKKLDKIRPSISGQIFCFYPWGLN